MVTTLTTTLAIGMPVLCVAATAAFALQTGGMESRGDVAPTAIVGRDAMVTADGAGATAGQRLATMHGGAAIHGNVTQTVRIGGSATVLATGQGAQACQALGTLGDTPACT